MNEFLLRRFLGSPHPLSPLEAAQRLRRAATVLLVKPHHKIGDLLVTTPLIRNLRLALPQAKLILVAGPYNAPAVLDNPDLDEIVIAALRGPLAPFRLLPLLYRLRRKRIDAALMLSTISHSTSAVALARRARPGFVAGLDDAPYGSSLARLAYDCVLAPPDDLKTHIVDYNLTILERLGIPIRDRRHRLAVTEAQRERAAAVLAEIGLDPAVPILGAQVGGTPRYPERQWPPSHYAAVLQRAAAELGYQPLLLGQEQDRRAMEEVSQMGKTATAMLLDPPFALYKAVLSRLTFFLTHDGGPVHVAAGVGVPSYFVFLSTPPWRWAPYGPQIHVWEEFHRPPSPSEVWERMKPLLEAALEESLPREGAHP